MESHRRVFTSDPCQLADMRALVGDACCRAWGASAEAKDAIDLFVLALDEAATNVIVHAYGRRADQPIELRVDVDGESARLSLHHDGKEFDPRTAPPPVFDGSRHGGFGVYLIGQAVDSVEYGRDEQGRCVIRLIKRRPVSSS
jgi:anti-sigma regulatory factor (Ser/Thr protein kinase)